MKGSLYFLAILLVLVLAAPAAAMEYDLLHTSPGNRYRAVSLVDWDGDGDMEVLAGNYAGNRAEVWDYNHMLNQMVMIESVGLAWNPHDVDAADLDHDGDMDIVAGIRFLGVYVLLNHGMSWSAAQVNSTYSWQVEITDFDSDGHLDIFSGTEHGYIKMLYGDGTGNFTQGPAPIPEYSNGCVVGMNVVDFNFDGKPDLLGQAHYYITYSWIRAYPNLSTPGSPAWGASIGPVDGYPPIWSRTPSADDFDGNGYVDYVGAMEGDPTIWWGYGDGVNFWWEEEILVDRTEPYCNTFAGDLNQDGNPDIIVGGYQDMYGLQFYFGDGAGNFTHEEYPQDHGMTDANGFKLGDVNGDGLTDIVTVRWQYADSRGYDVLLQTHSTVALDIKPGSCPNPLNVKSRGVLPVAILGKADFDVEQIDTASIRLEGIAPIRSAMLDVATPFEPHTGKDDCLLDCNDWGPDGLMDLTLKFKTQDIVGMLGDDEAGGCTVLGITGNLKEEYGGTPFEGEDVLKVINRGGSARRPLDSRLNDRGSHLPGQQDEETPEEFNPRR